ncbi:MAG: hypothetical protein ACK53L_06645, partial [Pirellulaceae bacterium]
IRVPFAIQWKGKVPAGLTFSQPVMGFDVHATALAAAGVEVANDKPLDGVDLLPYLRGELTGRPHEALFWRAGDKYAVRLGDWKLVHEPMAGETMLFNLAVDIGEQENLAEKEVAKLRELQLAFDQWASPMEPARWVRQDQSNAEVGGKLKASGSAPGTARRAKGASRIQAAFQAADSNRDGQLTREEYPQPEIFEMVDTNHDGFATLEEVRAYYLQLRAQPGAKAK